jgi:cobalt-zinc-cadmium efflux system outer membrane protein
VAGALRDSGAIAKAKTAVQAAQAGIEQAGVRPNPTLGLTTQHYRPRPAGQPQQPDHLVSFSDTWERGDKRQLRIAQAEAWRSGAQDDAADTRRQVLHDVRWAWFDLWRAERALDLAQQTATAHGQTLDAAQKRFDAGDLPGADVDRLRIEAERAQNDLRAARVERRHAQAALASLLAIEGQAAGLVTSGPLADPQPRDDRDLDRLIDQRPDVQSALQAVEAARQAVSLAGAQRARDIGWSVLAERDRASGLGNTVGVGVTVPLLWGNDYRGDIAHARADQRAAEQRLDQLQAQAHAEAAQAEADLRDARAQSRRFEEGVLVATQRAAEAAEYAYAHGAAGLMDLLDARRTLHGLQGEALQARTALLKAGADRDAALTPIDALR